jgi:hypothetical protein
MALTVTRSTTLFNDQDTDGQFDFGDTVLTKIRISNGATPATNVSVTDTLNGVTLVPGSVQVTPIAFDDNFNITGNTPITITFAQLLANDVDPDGLHSGLTVTNVLTPSAGSNFTVDYGAQTITFTPQTGLDIGQSATLQYTITDSQTLASVSTGVINFAITDVVWYVDNTYTGANGTADGSYMKPFTSLVPLDNGAVNDAPGETIFVYHNSATNYSSGITLQAGQKLIGDGVAFNANNIAIGGTLRTGGSDVATNAVISLNSGTVVKLSTDNTVKGVTLDSNGAAAIGMADGGGSVTTAAGTLLVSNVTFTGAGQAIKIDAGGNLNMTIDSLTSTASAGEGVHLAGTASSGTGLLTGTVNITTGAITTSTNDGFAIGFAAGLTASSGGNANITYGGTIGSVGLSLVDIQDRTGGTVTFSGALSEGNITSGLAGIKIDQNAGTVNFTGEMFISTGGSAGTGISITNSSAGTVSINAGGNGLDLNVANGTGINWVDGGTLSIQGSGNTIASTSGRLFIGQNGTIGTNGITFATTSTNGNVSTGPAISLDNVDKVGAGLFNGGNFTASQNSASGALSITNGSSADAVFGNFTTANVTTAGIGAITISGSSGNYTFNGDVTLNTGVGHAINLVNNTGGTTSFTGGNLNIDTTTGIAINATNTSIGANTLTISGANNVVDKNGSTNGAIFISGVTSNINLLHVNSAQSTSSTVIYLKDNGASGSFVITGDAGGTNGSGGTLNGSTGADNSTTTGIGVYLENANNVVLEDMTFNGTYQNYGIYGVNVNNFTLRDSFLQGAYGTTDVGPGAEAAVKFGSTIGTQGLKGTGLFEGNTIQNGYADNLVVTNFGNNTLNLTIKDSASQQAVFNANNNSTGNDSVHIETGGTSNSTIVIDGVQFTGSRGDQVQVVAVSNATQNVTIKNSTFTNSNTAALGGGIELGAGGVGNYNVTYLIDNNTVKGAVTSAIRPYFVGLNGTINGIISNNTVGTPGGGFQSTIATGAGSTQGFGIWAGIDKSNGGTVTHAVRINNNTIADTGSTSGGGIVLSSANGGASGTARLEATITANTVSELHPTFSFGAFYAKAGGATTDDTGKIGIVLNSNTFTATQGNAVILDQVTQNAQFYVPGYNNTGNGDDGEANAWGAPGVASSRLNLHWTFGAGGGGTNSLINGTGPNQTPGRIDAITLFNASNQNFVLPVPVMAAPAAPEDWETSIQERFGTDRAVDATGDTGDAPGTPGTGTGGETSVGTPEAGGNAPAPALVDDGVLTQAELDQLVDAAIQRWADAGATEAQLGAMRAVSVGIVDMSGIFLGGSTVGAISVDSDGGGKGWFVDTTPGEDSEFAGSGNVLNAVAGGGAEGKTDLLTVIMHELGHQIGLDDIYQTGDAAELMYGYVNSGERRLPQADDLAGADLSLGASNGYALTPVVIGTIPANKIVDVYFKATIDDQTNQFVVNPQNSSTATYDPALNATGVETMVLDSLTLGNRVFNDLDLDGFYDAGEGVVGVVLELYADIGTAGWDTGDTLLGQTTTLANGLYSFAGLAPGEYIVVVKASNFNAGQPLAGLETLAGASDPDNNIDHDDNGIAGITDLGTAIGSLPITLTDLGTEPVDDGDLDADTNMSLDFGFRANQPPVANDDGVSVGEDSGANDLTTQLLGNDTDPENDTRTIQSATQGANGATSVVAGVLTYTPNANYSGADSFTYTINDGKGHTDTATVTVTVGAVNDRPTHVVPGNQNINEDNSITFTGGIAISVADVDAGSADLTTTLSIADGALTVGAVLAGLVVTGEGTNALTLVGTLAEINDALNGLKYAPVAHANGQRTLTITTNDGGATGTDPGDSGTPTTEEGTSQVVINLASVNDEPAGTDDSNAASEGVTYTFATTDFSAGFSDPIDSNTFAGVKITTLPLASGGVIKLNGVAISAGAVITKAQLDNNELTFVPAAGSAGSSPTFTFQVQDNGGTSNGGVDLDQSPNTYTINIASGNAAPVIDLNAADPGIDNSASFTENAPGAVVLASTLTIADSDDTMIESATVAIGTGFIQGVDNLTVNGASSGSGGGLSYSYDASTGILTVTGSATLAAYETLLRKVDFQAFGDAPGASRAIEWKVNDGTSNSTLATTTVTITQDNDAPSGTSSTITAAEDVHRVLTVADLGFSDPDGTFASVTISGVSGGKIYYDADGAGGADPVEATLPETYTALQISDGKVSFRALQDANGAALGTITFAVTDNGGATDATPNTLTVDVTAVDDPAVAQPDAASTAENAVKTGDLFADNGSGPDSDVEGDSFAITEITVGATNYAPGTVINLPSGAKLTVNADGTYSYDPNGAFDTLTDNSSGAVNTSAQDTFTYKVTGGDTATVTITVNGVAGPGDRLRGDSGNNVITGTPQVDIFMLEQGGSDTAYGLGSNDGFYMGGALDALDHLDGAGNTNDQLILQGDYSAGLTLGANNLLNIEVLAIMAGNNTYFGNPGTNLYDYNLTTVDANVAAGQRLVVDATALLIGEDFTFNGSAEMDGAFTIGGGRGTDTLTGGAGADLFLFHKEGQWGASDSVNGGGGQDELAFRGNYTVTFGAAQITNVEVISLLSGQFARFGQIEGNFNYTITTDNGNVAAGQRMVIDAGQLTAGETVTFIGTAELDGYFWIAGGAGFDNLLAGAGNDLLIGGLGGDHLYGGAGNDTFRYRSIAESVSGATDGIADFTLGDIIDLSQIDADTTLAGNQAFNFIGNAAFGNQAGQLRFEHVSGQEWLVQGDVNGDGISDFQIYVTTPDNNPITSSDFLL